MSSDVILNFYKAIKALVTRNILIGYNEKYAFGNLKTETSKYIWPKASYRHMHKQFREDWEKISFCSECSYAYVGGDCAREGIADTFFYNTKGPDQVKHLVYID